jgi:tetratricopeptide (TPR) repeat protein
MDHERRRRGLRRVVEVDGSGSGGRYGSGYAVGDDLVLTAGHLAGEGVGYPVRILGEGAWHDASLIWRDQRAMGDAALLRVGSAPWAGEPDRAALRWGRLADDGVPCRAWGFPKGQEEPDGVRDVEALQGTADRSTADLLPNYGVDLELARSLLRVGGRSGWRGMSGAALLGPGRELLGVIVEDRTAYGASRLAAVPAEWLLRDETFAALVGASPGALEDVADPYASHTRVADLDAPESGFLDPAYAAQLPAGHADFHMLQARYRQVPFLGRDDELRRLREWWTAPGRFSAAVVVGDGGAGKTRLGSELCAEVAGHGWSAGFANLEELDAALAAGTQIELVWPTLLVVDYPDRLTGAVIELIGRLAGRQQGAPLRVLLLDRTPGRTGAEPGSGPLPDSVRWWKDLNRGTKGLLARRTRGPIRLDAGGLGQAERLAHATAALRVFSQDEAAGLPVGLDLRDDGYRNPLKVHLATLLAWRGEIVRSSAGVVHLFLDRERRRWQHRLDAYRREYGDILYGVGEAVAHQAVALATLTAPSREEAESLLSAVPGLAGTGHAERRRALSRWLESLFPGGGRIAPLAPDLLAEQLLHETGNPELAELVVAVHRSPACTAVHARRMLESLRLAAPGSAVARGALYRLLVGRLDVLVQAAAADRGTRNKHLAASVNAGLSLWADADPDGELAAAANTARLPLRHTLDDDVVRLGRSIAMLAVNWHERRPRRTAEERRGYADALTDLVAYQAAFGEQAAATATAGQAYREYSELGFGVPADALARSAYNYGTCLVRSGDHDQACELLEEATRRYAALPASESRPAFPYADALINLAVCHADLGHRRRAAEIFVRAVRLDSAAPGPLSELDYGLPELAGLIGDLARKSSEDQPDSAPVPGGPGRYRPPAGTAGAWDYHFMDSGGRAVLNRLAARLAEDAAARVPRKLRNAVLPFLISPLARQQARFEAENSASVLFMVAQQLAGPGRWDADAARAPAIASVALLRQFVQDDPALAPDIAHRLRWLGVYEFRAERVDDAIASARESADLYRHMAEFGFVARTSPPPTDPRLGLARACADLAEYLTDARRLPEAVAAAREATAAYRDLASHDPRHRADLAEESLRLSYLLAQQDQRAEAIGPLQQAADLFEELAATDDKYAEPLTAALSMLSASLGLVEPTDPDLTLAQVQRAVELIGRQAAADPGRRADQAGALVALSSTLGLLGRFTEARTTAERAVAIYRELATGDADPISLAVALTTLAGCAVQLGDPGDALTHAEQAVELLRGLPDSDPWIRFTHGTALGTLAQALLGLGQPADAIDPANAAIRALGKLADDGEALPGLEVTRAQTMVTLGAGLMLLGRPEEALPIVAEAASPRGAAPHGQWARGISAQAYLTAGTCLSQLGRELEALESLGQAEQLLRDLLGMGPAVAIRLAGALMVTSECQLSLGDGASAMGYLDRAIEVLRTAAPDHPGQRLELARALALRAITLVQLEQAAEGVPSSSEALDLCREQPPATGLERIVLGNALNAYGLCLLHLGRPDEASALFNEAAGHLREASRDTSAVSAVTGPLALALAGLADCRAMLGDPAGTITAAAEGCAVLEAAGVPEGDRPSPLLPLYGGLLAQQARSRFQLGPPDIELATAAAAVLRRLSATDDSARLTLAQMLSLEAVARRTAGAAGPEVLTPATEAVDLYLDFAEVPGVTIQLASSLALIGSCLVEMEDLPRALGFLRESSGYFRQVPAASPELLAEHIQVEHMLAFCHDELGDADSAASCLNVALELLRSAVDANPQFLPVLEDTRNWLADILNHRASRDSGPDGRLHREFGVTSDLQSSIGHPAYGLDVLRGDLDRFTFYSAVTTGGFLLGQDQP